MASKSKTAKKKKAGRKVAGPQSPRASRTKSESSAKVDDAAEVRVLNPEVVLPSNLLDEVTSPPDEKALAPADPLARYMAEIRRYPLLDKDQEHEIAVRYRETGDPALAQILVTSNLRFVVKIAAEYAKFGAKLIDLIQEGNVGLMHAVKEFNPEKGVRLITYAVWWIRGYIQEYLMRQYSMVRIGTTQNQRKLFYQLQKQSDELERLGFREGVALLSGRLGVSEDEIIDMSKRLSGRDVSLDQPLGEDQSSTLMDLQRTSTDDDALDDQIGRREQLQILAENLELLRPELNDKELFLLDNRLLADEPLTLQEIGDKYGITREAVRQLENRLLGKLRKAVLDHTPGSEADSES